MTLYDHQAIHAYQTSYLKLRHISFGPKALPIKSYKEDVITPLVWPWNHAPSNLPLQATPLPTSHYKLRPFEPPNTLRRGCWCHFIFGLCCHLKIVCLQRTLLTHGTLVMVVSMCLTDRVIALCLTKVNKTLCNLNMIHGTVLQSLGFLLQEQRSLILVNNV